MSDKKKRNKNRESGYVSSPEKFAGNPFQVLAQLSEENTTATGTAPGQNPQTAQSSAGQSSGAAGPSVPVPKMPDPPAPTVQLNSKVSLPDYSGLKPGTKYIGRDGKESSEIFDADDWIFLVESTFEAAGYDKDNWIKNARVKLVPQTPAFTWIRVAEQFTDWESFRTAFLDQFAPKESAIEKVNLLKSFKQRGKEPVLQYLNRMTMNHDKFLKDLPKEFSTWSTDKDAVRTRNAVISKVTKYYSRAFFLAGLRDEILAQVTIEGTEDFEEVVVHAQRTELALQLKEKSAQVSAVSSKAFKDAVQEEVSRQLKEVTGGVSAVQSQSKAPANKDKQRDVSKVTCFYCGQKAHYASSCAKRQEDRDKGNWRPTAQCPRMSREQFNALSAEDKNRGVRLFGRPRNGQQSGQAAQQPEAGAANPTAGTASSFGAIPRTHPLPAWSRAQAREDAFSHFRSSN